MSDVSHYFLLRQILPIKIVFYDIKFTIRPYICRPSRPMDGQGGDGDGRSFKNIEDIVCFKCGEKGHFANRCTKGHLAFISLQQNQKQAGENIGK